MRARAHGYAYWAAPQPRYGSRYGSYGPVRRSRNWEICRIGSQSPSPGGHSCVTHSRNPADTGGHERTRRRSTSSTGGTARTPEGTRGHDMTPVRDREAPGSNPGPPTKNRIQI